MAGEKEGAQSHKVKVLLGQQVVKTFKRDLVFNVEGSPGVGTATESFSFLLHNGVGANLDIE